MTTLLVTLYAVAALSVTALGAWIMRSGRRTPARVAIGVFLLATVVWTGQAVWAVVFPTDNPGALVAWTMPVAAVVVAHARTLVHALTDAGWRARPRDVINLGAHPLVMVAIAAIPPLRPYVVDMRTGTAAYGWIFWVHVVVSYAFLGKALLQLIMARYKVSSLAGKPIGTMLFAWTLPLIGNALTVFVIGPHGPDVTPIGFIVMVAVLWRAILREGLADIVPIARAQVFEHLVDAVFVLDALERLVDANAKARDLARLSPPLERYVGRPIAQVCPPIADALVDGEHNVDMEGARIILDVSVTALRDMTGAHIGRIVHARDVTQQALSRIALATTHRELQAQARRNEKLRAELADQVVRDSGTGLHNRRYVMENLPGIVADCEARREPLSIAVLDIDNFKAVNDNHGHSAGDRVLAAVARAMERMVPEGAVARFGGEEFIVLLPGVDEDGALAAAEAMRLACAGVRVRSRGGAITVTLSAGVATAEPGSINSAALIDAADVALYKAKRAGRNLTSHATLSL